MEKKPRSEKKSKRTINYIYSSVLKNSTVFDNKIKEYKDTWCWLYSLRCLWQDRCYISNYQYTVNSNTSDTHIYIYFTTFLSEGGGNLLWGKPCTDSFYVLTTHFSLRKSSRYVCDSFLSACVAVTGCYERHVHGKNSIYENLVCTVGCDGVRKGEKRRVKQRDCGWIREDVKEEVRQCEGGSEIWAW